MKVTIKTEHEVKYLKAFIGARYWEDTEVDGVFDTEDGDNIPCKSEDGEYWCPIIELETGVITNWEKGKTASVHYKSCDDNSFYLVDGNDKTVAMRKGYVINMMCTAEDGYGDYVIMDIDADGKIENWKADLTPFEKYVQQV
jgi:hypothetical protein